MVKVYVNGEWMMTFDNQYQLDNWYQAQDMDYVLSNQFEIEYEEEEL